MGTRISDAGVGCFEKMPALGSLDLEGTQVTQAGEARLQKLSRLGHLEVSKRVHAGEVAPDFSITTLDDVKISLADYRGKFVLLDFWATWCGPCVAEHPYLQATHEAFKDDGRVVMIGLSSDRDVDALREFIREHQVGWPQGLVLAGPTTPASIHDAYGLIGIPRIFLIGPQGKILAEDLRGTRIKEAVTQALESEFEP
jgi:peroxiredoxin